MIQRTIANLFKLNKCFINTNTFRFSSKLSSHKIEEHNSDSVPFDFTPDNYKEIDNILAKYPANCKRSGIMPLLYLAQKQCGNFVPLTAMKKIAKILDVADMDVYEVASFYTMFNRTKVGKFHLQVCGTTPCMLCGSREIIKAIEQKIGCSLGQTSADGLWTLEEVECLGACANAPMLQVNGEYVYEDLTPENVVKLLDDLKEGKDKKGPQTNRRNAEGPQSRTSLTDVNFVKSERKFDRDFTKAKEEWKAEKERQRAEAEKKKAQAKK